jgi:hypothetical protein
VSAAASYNRLEEEALLEDVMGRDQVRISLGRKVVNSSLSWMILGALVGGMGGIRNGVQLELVSSTLGGMILLPVVGVVLGLIGGDCIGSLVGGAGGLLGSILSRMTTGSVVDVMGMQFLIVFGALAGATCILYLRAVLWSLEIFRRGATQLLYVTQEPRHIPGVSSHHLASVRSRMTRSVHFGEFMGWNRVRGEKRVSQEKRVTPSD